MDMFALAYELSIVIARPSNAYGEHQAAFIGQGFIATAIQSILQGKRITIYGKPGTIRAYLHVKDIANGIIAVLEYGETGQSYNIGSGIGRNNIEVLNTIAPLASQANLILEFNTLPERAFDVPANVLDSRKLYAASKWTPKISFEDGIHRVWNAFLEQRRFVG